MNKLPTKQIYLLFIIIVGIIALSVYSTYALFTFESSTSDIVSIHIPKSLVISENIYEYQQITIEPNTIATTDVDIHNAFEYEVCYSVWFKVIGDNDTQNKVQVFEKNKDNLTSSGLLAPQTHIRVTLVIINDNPENIKINLGTIGRKKADGTCSLNISNDKSVVSTSYEKLDILTTKLIEETKTTKIDEGYLTYSVLDEPFTYEETDKIYTSNSFTQKNELFTLADSEYTTFSEIVEKNNLQDKDIYFCKEKDSCNILYKFRLSDLEIEEIEIENKEADTVEEKIIIIKKYHINKYEKLIGYSASDNGLRKVNEKDYVYYGDNPNNFIYYNCMNSDDLSSCELWRIIGFFYDNETKEYHTKIVRNNSIGNHPFSSEEIEEQQNNLWNKSTLYKYLNEEYKLLNNYDMYLYENLAKEESIKNLESNIKDLKQGEETFPSNINILSLTDYINTSNCKKDKFNEYIDTCLTNNWLNNIEIKKEWTLTSKEIEVIIKEEKAEDINIPQDDNEIAEENQDDLNEEENLENDESTETVENQSYNNNYIYTIGENILETDVKETLSVRPVVFLKPRILLLDGNGTLEFPYVVK